MTHSIQKNSRWEQIKNAYQEAETIQVKKSIGRKLEDHLVTSSYALKGVGRAGLQILESGWNNTPPVFAYHNLKTYLPEITKPFTDFKGWKAAEDAKWQSSKKTFKATWGELKKKVLQSFIR